MTDDELAMAYADGELDAISAKRFERRMADAPDLAAAVAAQRALRVRLRGEFASIVEAPLPERLTGLLSPNVVDLRPPTRMASSWRAASAMVACLIVGLVIGYGWQPPSGVSGGTMLASGSLARSLDRDPAGGQGSTRVLVSFRDTQGRYCRVFQAAAIDGIACHHGSGWAMQRTQTKGAATPGEYRQAGSTDASLLAAAQDMMAGDPLDPAAERAALERGWR